MLSHPKPFSNLNIREPSIVHQSTIHHLVPICPHILHPRQNTPPASYTGARMASKSSFPGRLPPIAVEICSPSPTQPVASTGPLHIRATAIISCVAVYQLVTPPWALKKPYTAGLDLADAFSGQSKTIRQLLQFPPCPAIKLKPHTEYLGYSPIFHSQIVDQPLQDFR